MIEKILERLKEGWRQYIHRNEDFYNGIRRGYDEAMKIVQKVSKEYEACEVMRSNCEVAKEYDWIPVSERLPEPFQRVLVYDAWDDSMTIEHLQENDSFIDSVVAWMPLPIAPYQKGE